MVSVVLGMLICLGLALVVMALVAVPARRAGRDVLSERGEEVVGSIRERQRQGHREGEAVEAVEAVEAAAADEVRSTDTALAARG